MAQSKNSPIYFICYSGAATPLQFESFTLYHRILHFSSYQYMFHNVKNLLNKQYRFVKPAFAQLPTRTHFCCTPMLSISIQMHSLSEKNFTSAVYFDFDASRSDIIFALQFIWHTMPTAFISAITTLQSVYALNQILIQAFQSAYTK